ncbi:MAG: hypothetical protein HC880_20500 [Bacteroidia bacterium]|nr:hypothetical protein [Bacteroidia bacterium]
MQDNYYFLRQLSQALAEKLGVPWHEGAPATLPTEPPARAMQLAECFSQDKDEIVLGFCNEQSDLYIKAILNAEIACLTFPADFFRARRNSVDLFRELANLRLRFVFQYANERSFSLFFERDYQLLFKMHGIRSNIVLFHQQDFVIGFHKRMEKDREILPNELNRPIPQNFNDFAQAGHQWKNLFPAFGKEVQQYLRQQNIHEKNPEQQWALIQRTLAILENPPAYHILDAQESPRFSLLPPDWLESDPTRAIRKTHPLEAATEFYYAYARVNYLEKEKTEALKVVSKKIKQGQNYLDKNLEKLLELEDSSRNEETANLIMANLHQIPAGVSSIEVYDFYHDTPRTIKLKKELSPQKKCRNLLPKGQKRKKLKSKTFRKILSARKKSLKS